MDKTLFQIVQGCAWHLLSNWEHLPEENWTVQGFGFLRYRVAPSVRLHVWDSRLRTPNVSDVHDHRQWGLTSYILTGQITNRKFTRVDGYEWIEGEIVCGIGGGMTQNIKGTCGLLNHFADRYRAGDTYSQRPEEIHQTEALDGTVTIIHQERTATDNARVFWPTGTGWVDAEPRIATHEEKESVIQDVLDRIRGE